MGKITDLKDKVFGRLYVKDFYGIKNHKSFWICLCECGEEKVFQGTNLKNGNTKSCGCIRKEISNKTIKYEKSNDEKIFKNNGKHPLLGVLNSMKQRCSNENCREYRWYGAKGIKVCDEWKKDSKIFIEWAISKGYKRGLTIDRIDNSKNYCPENCQFISREENLKKIRTDNVKNGKKYFKNRSQPRKQIYRPYKSR